MTRALRVISVQRGHDPADFLLCCFGGAGGLHVCALADQLHISTAIVPVYGGVLSALGMLVAPRERQLSRSQPGLLKSLDAQHIQNQIDEMANAGISELLKENVPEDTIKQHASLDLRYKGQSFTLNIPWENKAAAESAFHESHQQRYGHQMALDVELVNVRVAVKAYSVEIKLPAINAQQKPAQPEYTAQLYGFEQEVPVFDRQALNPGELIVGPALIKEQVSTTLVTEKWSFQLDNLGNLLLKKTDLKLNNSPLKS